MKRRRLGADRLIALAWAPNSAAMPADTSSAAGANAPVVGTAAAAFAALMVERMAAKSVAAASNASGLAITNDIAHLPPTRDNPAAPEPSMRMAGISYCDPPPSVGVFARFVAAQRCAGASIGDGWWLTRVVEGDGRGTVRTVVRRSAPSGASQTTRDANRRAVGGRYYYRTHVRDIAAGPDGAVPIR